MGVNDAIGEVAGGATYFWPGDAVDEIVNQFKIPTTRSDIQLSLSDDFLQEQSPEIAAALIAEELYRNFSPEFNTSAYKISGIVARDIVARFPWELSDDKTLSEQDKWFVKFYGSGDNVVKALQELAWLRHAFDAGATPADLIAWGVSSFTVIQLIWWQGKESETLLQRHIRAIRNGWGLRWLDEAVRDTYRNLLKFVDKGDAHPLFLEKFETELTQARELLDFFSPEAKKLTQEQQFEWAVAFGTENHLRILPDAVGRFSLYIPQALKRGVLRQPLEQVARYLGSVGVTPKTWSAFDETWFGR